MSKKRQRQRREAIPTHFTLDEFNEFVLPHLPEPPRFGPAPKVTAYKLFNYILRFLYLGANGPRCLSTLMKMGNQRSTTAISIDDLRLG